MPNELQYHATDCYLQARISSPADARGTVGASGPTPSPTGLGWENSRAAANGIVIGSVELHGSRFVAIDLGGEIVGNYATLFDAREVLLQARR